MDLKSTGRLPFLALLVATAPVGAQNVDFFQGPIVSSHRVVGLGGAYVSVGYGADGHLVNPAAFALRDPFGADDYFDWDATLSWLGATRDDVDLTQSGRGGAFDEVFFWQGGGHLKLGRHGFGVHAVTQRWKVRVRVNGELTDALYRQNFGGPGYAFNWMQGELVCGLVPFAGKAAIVVDDVDLVSVEGGGLLTGCIWGPFDAPWRLGATLRTPVVGVEAAGDPESTSGRVPDGIAIPAELTWGGSVMFGPRRYNVRPTFGYGEDPPARSLARRYVLLSADLVLTGATPDAFGVESFLEHDLQRSGKKPTIGARAGAESEVIANRLALRAGSYFEPSRFERTVGRMHATAGADLRISVVWDLRLSTSLDVAPDYLNWGLGLGFWH